MKYNWPLTAIQWSTPKLEITENALSFLSSYVDLMKQT